MPQCLHGHNKLFFLVLHSYVVQETLNSSSLLFFRRKLVAYQSSVSYRNDHVRIEVHGNERGIEKARAFWTQVSALCREHDCLKVLGVSDSTGAVPTMDGYEHADMFRELGISEKTRIAWAELDDHARKATHFVETVLLNRGWTCKLFDNEKDARQWLFSGSGND